jgi:predicted adenylyl cyclase CyaB
MDKNIEARGLVKNIDKFRERIKKLSLKKEKEYSCKDYIFKPKSVEWDLNNESIKIREFTDGRVKINFHFVEWKNGIKQDKFGFKQQVSSIELAFEIMNKLNFEEIMSYEKKGEFYVANDFDICLENVEKLGWIAEIETENNEQVNKAFEILGLTKINDSMPNLMYKILKGDTNE